MNTGSINNKINVIRNTSIEESAHNNKKNIEKNMKRNIEKNNFSVDMKIPLTYNFPLYILLFVLIKL